MFEYKNFKLIVNMSRDESIRVLIILVVLHRQMVDKDEMALTHIFATRIDARWHWHIYDFR